MERAASALDRRKAFRSDGGAVLQADLSATARQVKRPTVERAVPFRPIQKGRTITRMTMIAVAIPGISFMRRSALSDGARWPAAIFLP